MVIRNPGSGELPPGTPQHSDRSVAESDSANAPHADVATSDRQPKGDHNRRLALGMDIDAFAAEAGVTTDELRGYEGTWPDHEFDPRVAARVGQALQRLEADPPPSQKVSNGPLI